MKIQTQDRFFLFCENACIKVLESRPVQYGVKHKLSRNGEEAYMTLFDNGNSFPQGSKSSTLFKLLRIWSNIVPEKRELTDEEKRHFSSLGMPDFYMSWREWHEDADILQEFINNYGEPDEINASESYKSHREIMFHDYMFKQATNLAISLDVVRHIIISWINRFCYMNINADFLADNVIGRIEKGKWQDEKSGSYCVSYYDVLDALAYVFTRFCYGKWIVCDNNAVCPQKGDLFDCLNDLVDSMYVYCINQHVLSYTRSNFQKLLKRDTQKLSWIDLKTDSPIEIKLGEAMYQSGILTIPQFQALAPDRRFKIDYLVKTPNGGALAIECDGLEYHANKNAYIKDRRRDNLLLSHGFQVLRFSSIDINEDLQGCIDQIEHSFCNFQHGKIVYHRNGGLGYFGSNL